MLNTDVELIYDIDVSAVQGTSCTIGTDCASAGTKDLVTTYATVSLIMQTTLYNEYTAK